MHDKGEDEEALKAVQDGQLYPVGRALRATFDADNHHTLGRDVTGLMIDLSHVPYPAEPQRSGKSGGSRRGEEGGDRLMKQNMPAAAGQGDSALQRPGQDQAGLGTRLAQWWRRIVPGGSGRPDVDVRTGR